MSDEIQLLGELMLNADSTLESRFDMKAEYFSSPLNGKIFDVMLKLRDATQTIYHQNLRELLDDEDKTLLDYYDKNIMVPEESLGFDFYAERVINRYRFMRLVNFGKKWGNQKFDHDKIDKLYEEFYSDISALDDCEFESDLVTPRETNIATLDEIEENREADKPRYFSTGFPPLDEIIGGLYPQDYTTIGARTGVGKTILAMQIASAVMKQDGKVALFTIEMSFKEYNHRFIASEASINPQLLRKPELLQEEHIDRLIEFCENSTKKHQYRINRKQRLNIHQIRRLAAKTKRQLGGLDLVIVDHLHILHSTGKGMDFRSQVKEATLECKRIAQELNCHVIGVAQCNRESEKENRAPRISDLKESGSIEEDSNIILLIHRTEQDPSRAEILVGKNRHGPSPRRIPMRFIDDYVRFESDI